MKISIGSRIISGPWGGGNLFVVNLSKYLIKQGHKVVYDLSHKDIDLILLTDPRSKKESTSRFNHFDIVKYKKFVNPNVNVVQRINECDERKNTSGINQFYLNASNCADKVVFVSSWLESIFIDLGMDKNKTSVIMSGSDNEIFKPPEIKYKSEKTKLVTHHWSSHQNKGFETYFLIDNLLEDAYWKDKIEFTYIGNLDKQQNFKNVKVLNPLSGSQLSDELGKHDIYVTGSINEPSGNHHIEGALCGLPVLYKESGGVPEYAKEFGESFNDDFSEKLKLIIENYSYYQNKMSKYPFVSESMCDEYYKLFENLVKNNRKNESVRPNFLNSFLFRFKHKVIDNFLSLLKDQTRGFIIKLIKKMFGKKYG